MSVSNSKAIELYISKQSITRQSILINIHNIIIETDKSVKADVEKMMGKEMIVYKANHMMKYALASVKNYLSLHVMPIYGHKPLHLKYQQLLSKANFQKGCINFNTEDEMPLDILQKLITDCATIDLAKIKEDYLQSKKVLSNKSAQK